MIFLDFENRTLTEYDRHTAREIHFFLFCFSRDFVSLETAIFMYKLNNNLLPCTFNDYFTVNSNIHNYNTRDAQNLHLPLNRTSCSQSSIVYNGPVLWNNLQTSVKHSKTVRQFKRLYKQYLIDVINAQCDM